MQEHPIEPNQSSSQLSTNVTRSLSEADADLRSDYLRIKQELKKVIVGQEDFIDLLLVGLIARGHVLIEGVPGVAKTLTAKLLSKTLDVDFNRIQFTPDLMPSDILGTSFFNVKTQEFEFHKGPIFSNLVLIDEINRAPAKTQSALFEVMEERQVTIDGEPNQMQSPFMVIATQNPIEQEGTYRLPEAQLDRFLFKINVQYPSQQEEYEILQRKQTREQKAVLEQIDVIFNAAEVVALQNKATKIRVENKLLEYISKLVQATRRHPSLFLGASPRASIAILESAKAWAAIQARGFMIPEDVQKVAGPVLEHRIVLSPEREMEGITKQQTVLEIIKEIELPR